MAMRYWIAAALFVAATSTAHAQLVRQHREIELRAGVTDEQAVAMFAFTNQGNKAVKIINVRSSCGCTSAVITRAKQESEHAGEQEIGGGPEDEE